MTNFFYFFAAYLFLWGCLAFYMFGMARKQETLHHEIRILKERLRVRE